METKDSKAISVPRGSGISGGLGMPPSPFVPPVKRTQATIRTWTMMAKLIVTKMKYGPFSLSAGRAIKNPARPTIAIDAKKAGQKPRLTFTVSSAKE